MLHKKGTPAKLTDVTTSELEFEKLKNKIAQDNNLKRCTSCGQLLAKFDLDNKIINVQRKNLDIIAEVSRAQIKCPNCHQINTI